MDLKTPFPYIYDTRTRVDELCSQYHMGGVFLGVLPLRAAPTWGKTPLFHSRYRMRGIRARTAYAAAAARLVALPDAGTRYLSASPSIPSASLSS